jgi:hypothetical protein
MRFVPGLCGWLCVTAALLAVASGGSAQDKGDKNASEPGPALPKDGKGAGLFGPAEPPERPIRWQDHGHGLRVCAAMHTFAVANPISVAAVRVMVAGGETGVLLSPDWDLELQEPLPLSRQWLDKIQDRTRNPNLAVPMPWHERPEADQAFIRLQWEALINSKIVSSDLFKTAGEEKESRWVTFDDLWNHPAEYRGRVIRVQGTMIRLRAHKVRKPEATAQGIDFIYEGWVVGQTPHRNPYCIIFVTLPDGLEPQETMNQPITFYGYFIKRFIYDAQTATRQTNLLIGPTVYVGKVAPTPPRSDDIFSRDFLYFAGGGLVAIAVALWGLHLWFRRSDRAVSRQLATFRDRNLQLADEPLPDEAAIQPEINSVVKPDRAMPPETGTTDTPGR